MVTASNNATTVLLDTTKVQSLSNGSAFHEARRLPEVTDDAQSSEVDTLPTPNLDSWKPTIKDHKVISFLKIVFHK